VKKTKKNAFCWHGGSAGGEEGGEGKCDKKNGFQKTQNWGRRGGDRTTGIWRREGGKARGKKNLGIENYTGKTEHNNELARLIKGRATLALVATGGLERSDLTKRQLKKTGRAGGMET